MLLRFTTLSIKRISIELGCSDGDKGGNARKSTSRNQTHYSPSDPDARLTMKKDKPMDLYYRSQLSVDIASHFIPYIQAFAGNAADNISLPEIVKHIVGNMRDHNIQVEELLADRRYNSGEAIKALIDYGIEGIHSQPGKI